MKTKKLISVLSLAACAATAMCMTGCATDYTVTVKQAMNDNNDYKLTVKSGDTVTMDMLAEKYSDEFMVDTGFYCDRNLYTDEACLTKFVGGVDSNTTLYFGSYNPLEYGRVVFDYDGNEYVVYRAIGATLTAMDFSRSAYGIGEASDYVFYSDAARTSQLNISGVEIETTALYGNTNIYVADAE